MEKLIPLAFLAIFLWATMIGFLVGAVANLFGFDFWTFAGISFGLVAAYMFGLIFRL